MNMQDINEKYFKINREEMTRIIIASGFNFKWKKEEMYDYISISKKQLETAKAINDTDEIKSMTKTINDATKYCTELSRIRKLNPELFDVIISGKQTKEEKSEEGIKFLKNLGLSILVVLTVLGTIGYLFSN